MTTHPRYARLYTLVQQLSDATNELKYRDGVKMDPSPSTGTTFAELMERTMPNVETDTDAQWEAFEAEILQGIDEIKQEHTYMIEKAGQIKTWLNDNKHLAGPTRPRLRVVPAHS